MKAPSLYPEIKGEMAIIARAVICGEDDDAEREWRSIRTQIQSMAARCKERNEDDRCGFRITPDAEFIECRNCGDICPAGSKKCLSCPQRFKRRRS
jgi:hypothetical protein